jgi:superfamily II DNA/RNA helicase
MFSQLGLSPAVCASLARLGYEAPTPIQTDAIPLVLSGVDLLARAQTGTGKTAAFGLPMIERLLTRESRPVRRSPGGLVLVPTRELAVQVHQALSTYAASTPLRVAAIFGGDRDGELRRPCRRLLPFVRRAQHRPCGRRRDGRIEVSRLRNLLKLLRRFGST